MAEAQLKSVESPSSERQVALIQATFKNNDDLLRIVRNLFFGLDLSESEKDLVKSVFNGKIELIETVRRKIYPVFELDMPNLPTGLLADFWLDMDKDILGAHTDAIYQRVNSKSEVLKLLNRAIGLLQNTDGEKIDLSLKSFEADPLQVGLLTRALYTRTVVHGLGLIKQIADLKVESEKDKKERMKKDSTQ